MDDVDIAVALKKIQQNMLQDEEVVHFYTNMKHLQMRIKNVAIMKLFKLQQQKQTDQLRQGLVRLIKDVLKNSSELKR
jgi:hypothetical protein